MSAGKLLALAFVGATALAPPPARGIPWAPASEGPEPHCVDAVVIARHIEIRGVPQRVSGYRFEISAFEFDVERVLFGATKARRLTIHSRPLATGDLSDRRWLFLLAGSDAIGWKEVGRAEGVARDTRGRDVYPLRWPMRPYQYADGWLPDELARFVRPLEIDREAEFHVCERYEAEGCERRPPLPGPVRESIPGHGIVLDDVPALMAARGKDCLPATEGTSAPSAEHYRLHGDYESLAWIERRLRKGMARGEVVALLGSDAYSPIDGQHYYGSDASSSTESPGQQWPVVLVVEFRDDERDLVLTDRLQGWRLGPIGE